MTCVSLDALFTGESNQAAGIALTKLMYSDHAACLVKTLLKLCLVNLVQDDPWQQYKCFNECSSGHQPDRDADANQMAVLSSCSHAEKHDAHLSGSPDQVGSSCRPPSAEPPGLNHISAGSANCSAGDPSHAYHSHANLGTSLSQVC